MASTMNCDRSVEVQKFEDTKAGVLGLIDSGVTTLPPLFVHPQKTINELKAGPIQGVAIPTVDLSGVHTAERPAIVAKVAHAAREYGFFLVTNHGIPVEVTTGILGGLKAFHEQSGEVKKMFYNRNKEKGVSFYSNIDLFYSKAADWRDTLQVRLGPNPPAIELMPEICRKEIVEWDKEAKRVGETLLELLCEGLGVEKERLKKLACLEGREVVGNYYPPCPQPDLTLGISGHRDPITLTLLLQDNVGGLQVKYGDGWVDAKPVPGALVINIGDILQIMSNGEYKSAVHRVLANHSQQPRLSVTLFLKPSDCDMPFGPFPELISPEKAAMYRELSVRDYEARFFKTNISDELPPYFNV